jgi:hypothetical protein
MTNNSTSPFSPSSISPLTLYTIFEIATLPISLAISFNIDGYLVLSIYNHSSIYPPLYNETSYIQNYTLFNASLSNTKTNANVDSSSPISPTLVSQSICPLPSHPILIDNQWHFITISLAQSSFSPNSSQYNIAYLDPQHVTSSVSILTNFDPSLSTLKNVNNNTDYNYNCSFINIEEYYADIANNTNNANIAKNDVSTFSSSSLSSTLSLSPFSFSLNSTTPTYFLIGSPTSLSYIDDILLINTFATIDLNQLVDLSQGVVDSYLGYVANFYLSFSNIGIIDPTLSLPSVILLTNSSTFSPIYLPALSSNLFQSNYPITFSSSLSFLRENGVCFPAVVNYDITTACSLSPTYFTFFFSTLSGASPCSPFLFNLSVYLNISLSPPIYPSSIYPSHIYSDSMTPPFNNTIILPINSSFTSHAFLDLWAINSSISLLSLSPIFYLRSHASSFANLAISLSVSYNSTSLTLIPCLSQQIHIDLSSYSLSLSFFSFPSSIQSITSMDIYYDAPIKSNSTELSHSLPISNNNFSYSQIGPFAYGIPCFMRFLTLIYMPFNETTLLYNRFHYQSYMNIININNNTNTNTNNNSNNTSNSTNTNSPDSSNPKNNSLTPFLYAPYYTSYESMIQCLSVNNPDKNTTFTIETTSYNESLSNIYPNYGIDRYNNSNGAIELLDGFIVLDSPFQYSTSLVTISLHFLVYQNKNESLNIPHSLISYSSLDFPFFDIYLYNGSINFASPVSSTVSIQCPYNDGQWHQMVLIITSDLFTSVITLYCDYSYVTATTGMENFFILFNNYQSYLTLGYSLLASQLYANLTNNTNISPISNQTTVFASLSGLIDDFYISDQSAINIPELLNFSLSFGRCFSSVAHNVQGYRGLYFLEFYDLPSNVTFINFPLGAIMPPFNPIQYNYVIPYQNLAYMAMRFVAYFPLPTATLTISPTVLLYQPQLAIYYPHISVDGQTASLSIYSGLIVDLSYILLPFSNTTITLTSPSFTYSWSFPALQCTQYIQCQTTVYQNCMFICYLCNYAQHFNSLCLNY